MGFARSRTRRIKGSAVTTNTDTMAPQDTDTVSAQIGPAGRRLRAPVRRRGATAWWVAFAQVAILVGIIVAWEWASGPRGASGTYIDEYYVSTPRAIADALRRWSSEGILWSSILVTFRTAATGFAIGAFLGMSIGFVLGANTLIARVFHPFVTALYAVPRLALIPLFMLWFGIGEGAKVALTVSVVFFLVFHSTYAGVRSVDPTLLDKLRLMRASWWQVHLKVSLPSAVTFIISGLSISMPYAVVATVTAEMLSSNRGMGYLLIRSSSQFFTAGVFAAIVVLMVMGVTLMVAVSMLERWLLRWKR